MTSDNAIVTATDRLILRRLNPDDAAFILELVNDPDWLRYIGDKDVHNLEDARGYIGNGPMAMYARVGFGLWRVELRDGGEPIGICGLIKRETLDDVDIGFAYLPRFRRRGYAREAARATIDHGANVLGLRRIVAITSPDNAASGRLLEAIGLKFERVLELSRADPVRLYAWTAEAAVQA